MKKKVIAIASFLILFIVFSSPMISQETEPKSPLHKFVIIVLKNGTELRGKLISDGPEHVTIETPLGSKSVKKDLIREIKPEPEEPRPAISSPPIAQEAEPKASPQKFVTIILKNGTEIWGKLISDGPEYVTIETPLGSKSVKKDLIQKIRPGPTVPDQAPRPEADETQPPKFRRFSLSLGGHFGFVQGDYLNLRKEGLAKTYSHSGDFFDFPTLKNSWIANLEISYQITKNFSLGLGGGYLFKSIPYNFGWEASGGDFSKYSGKVAIRGWVVNADLSFSLPLTKKWNVFLNGGGDYYFSRLSDDLSGNWNYLTTFQVLYMIIIDWTGTHYYYYNIPGRTKGTSSTNQACKTEAIGFHGGLGVEFALSSRLSLILEGQYRNAQLKNFKGSSVYQGNGNTSVDGDWTSNKTTTGTLCFNNSNTYLKEKPTEADPLAILNMSGLSIQSRIRFRF